MRLAAAVFALLVCGSVAAQEPVYLDQLMEMSLETLQRSFPGLKREGCYRIGTDRFLSIDISKKEQKPWRVTYAAMPCRRGGGDDGAQIEVRQRSGVELGNSTVAVLEKLGRPDASAAPDPSLKRFGDTEYFYICRVSEGCARHTSIFVKDGMVSAIAEWYSE
jgi:hypothetical protein